MSVRLPVGPDERLEDTDPARRYRSVEDFARTMAISTRTAWRLVIARDPRLDVVRLGTGPRPIVRVRLREIDGSGNT